LVAATRLFEENGFSATSIDDIASAAGVARPTVFTAVGGKASILGEAIDLALAGDSEQVPVSRREWFLQMIDEPGQARMLELHARNLRAMYERVADLYVAAEHAATVDPTVAELWSTMQSQRLLGAQEVSSSLASKGPLREGMDEQSVADILWCVATPMDYRRFVRERGWTSERYEKWLAEFMITSFLP
jgi:AcrR family transcriptional regulator